MKRELAPNARNTFVPLIVSEYSACNRQSPKEAADELDVFSEDAERRTYEKRTLGHSIQSSKLASGVNAE